MCYNAALVKTKEEIGARYGAAFLEGQYGFPAHFVSAFAHPLWPILKQGYTDFFRPAVWGLIPPWIKDAEAAKNIRDKTLNARFETLSAKPSFRGAVNGKRCAVPVDGFVEWRLHQGKKYPYHICMPDKSPFMLAGLWDRWEDPGTDTALESFTVVTVEACGLPDVIHNTKHRMPLILSRNGGEAWLDGASTFSEVAAALKPLYEPLTAWPVSREVSRPGGDKDHPGIQEPWEYPELPDLDAGAGEIPES